jgi:hypothetical protein
VAVCVIGFIAQLAVIVLVMTVLIGGIAAMTSGAPPVTVMP